MEKSASVFGNPWFVLVLCVFCSTAADTLSTIAWERRSWQYFVCAILLAPIAFLLFGYIGSKFGLSVASSLTNSLIVLGPVIVGLVFREEWRKMPWQAYVFMAVIFVGISGLVYFKPK